MSHGKSVIFCGNERVLCNPVAHDSHTRTVKINGSIENCERNCHSALEYHSWHEGILGCCKMKIFFLMGACQVYNVSKIVEHTGKHC